MTLATRSLGSPPPPARRPAKTKTLLKLMVAGLVLASPCPASAWDSDYHTAMIQLTLNIWRIPGIQGSATYFMPAGTTRNLCYTQRQTMAPKDRVYLDLVCGTDEPDHERDKLVKILAFEFLRHNSEAEERAAEEFDRAVEAYRNPRRGNAEAARYLGRSIHYLQDLSDISKNMDDDDGKYVREQGKELAQAYLREWADTRRYPVRLANALRSMRAEYKGPPTTPRGFVNGALKERQELARIVKEELRPFSGSERLGARDKLIRTYVQAWLIGQEQWVSMYLRYIGVPESP